jgi:uncharacterized membrane protein
VQPTYPLRYASLLADAKLSWALPSSIRLLAAFAFALSSCFFQLSTFCLRALSCSCTRASASCSLARRRTILVLVLVAIAVAVIVLLHRRQTPSARQDEHGDSVVSDFSDELWIGHESMNSVGSSNDNWSSEFSQSGDESESTAGTAPCCSLSCSV